MKGGERDGYLSEETIEKSHLPESVSRSAPTLLGAEVEALVGPGALRSSVVLLPLLPLRHE